MIIGVDAGALSISDDRLKTGVWRVTVELLKQLSRLDTKNSYCLYSFRQIDRDVLQNFSSSMENRILTPSFGYMKYRIPLDLMIRPTDIFLGLSQAIPKGRTGKAIGFIYDVGFLRYPEWYTDSAYRLQKQTQHLIDKSYRIITISECAKEDIIRNFGCKKENISVCYPGVSSIFSRSGALEARPYPFFLFVGSLWKGKNIPTLLRGFSKARKENRIPQHLLLVGGDYWKDGEIATTIKKLKLERYVHIRGHVDDTTLASLYRTATAFVTASKTEGFCMPVVESMHSGCPVIYSDIPVLREIAGNTGIPVHTDDPKQMASALVHLARHPDIRGAYGKKGIIRARNYSWDKFGARTYEIISSCYQEDQEH